MCTQCHPSLVSLVDLSSSPARLIPSRSHWDQIKLSISINVPFIMFIRERSVSLICMHLLTSFLHNHTLSLSLVAHFVSTFIASLVFLVLLLCWTLTKPITSSDMSFLLSGVANVKKWTQIHLLAIFQKEDKMVTISISIALLIIAIWQVCVCLGLVNT